MKKKPTLDDTRNIADFMAEATKGKGKRVTVTFKLPESLHTKLKLKALEEKVSLNDLVVDTLGELGKITRTLCIIVWTCHSCTLILKNSITISLPMSFAAPPMIKDKNM